MIASLIGTGATVAFSPAFADTCDAPHLRGSATVAAGGDADTNDMCWVAINGLNGPCQVTVVGTFSPGAPWSSGITATITPNPYPTNTYWHIHVHADASVPGGTYNAVANGTGQTSLTKCQNYSDAVQIVVIGKGLNQGCPQNDCGVGRPINVATGNMYESQTDFSSRIGTLPLSIERHYNSQSSLAGAFGMGWSSNLDANLTVSGTAATLTLPSGQQLPFSNSGSGWVATSTIPTTLTTNSSGYLVQTVDHEQYQFDTNGRLLSETNAQGDKLSFSSSGGNLLVSDNYSNTMTVTFWSGTGFVHTIQAMGQTFTYNYGFSSNPVITGPGANNLMSVGYTMNGVPVTRQYKYENASFPNALTAIVDETGQTYATWQYDANGNCFVSRVGQNAQAESYTVDYSNANLQYVAVTNQNGLVTNYFTGVGSDGLALITEVQQVSGTGSGNTNPATTYKTYNSVDLPAFAIDGNGFGSTWTYFPITGSDGRSLVNVETHGYLTQVPPTLPLTQSEFGSSHNMTKTTYVSWHPTFPEPTQIIYSGTNTQGTMVDYKQVDASYDSINGRLQTWTETDLLTPSHPT